MKIVFVIPVYNDWDSLKVLSQQIKKISLEKNWEDTEIVMVNDSSTQEISTSPNPFSVKSTIINLISNQGNQNAIAIGLSYVDKELSNFDHVIVMDADGEDKVSDVLNLINEAEKKDNKKIIFSVRAKRNEGPIYVFFYTIYKILFKLLTGQNMSLGHFSCIPQKLLKQVLSVSGLWTHYCAAITKSKISFSTLVFDKGPRITGVSHTSKKMLLFHGLASMTVYMELIVLRFLLISLTGMFLSMLSIGVVFYIKFFTEFSTFGWATNVTIGLSIIFIIFLLIGFLSLLSLINKNSSQPIPKINKYKDFILNVIKLV